MKKETYEKVIHFIRQSKILSRVVWASSKVLPVVLAGLFAVVSAGLILFKNPLAIRFITVPALTFLFVTVVRKLINRERPYDALGYEPLLSYKKGKGKSFPSRHTASALIIAFAFLYMHTGLGIVCLCLALCVAVSRVLAGMHYVSDVVCGCVLSVLGALIGFVWL